MSDKPEAPDKIWRKWHGKEKGTATHSTEKFFEDSVEYIRADLAKPSEWISGLKDHEIQELVNAIRDNLLCLDNLVKMGPLREMISRAATKYLEGKNLRIDRPSPTGKNNDPT